MQMVTLSDKVVVIKSGAAAEQQLGNVLEVTTC